MPAQLVVVEGSSQRAPILLNDRVIFEIGRSEDADLHLNDPDIVPIHLKIYKENKEFHVFDLSGRGFLVNGRRRLKHHLKHQDMIAIGSHALRFEDDPALEPEPSNDHVATVVDADSDDSIAFKSHAGISATVDPVVELEALKGNDTGKKFDLLNRPMSVMGRGIATDITVWDIRCSRIHCRIDGQGDQYTLSDMNSSNGTFVNGRKIDNPVLLRAGDTIKIGSTTLQFNQNL
jgi:pSer/pThr/pTyr-binding forkhead associated (FHA) protein